MPFLLSFNKNEHTIDFAYTSTFVIHESFKKFSRITGYFNLVTPCNHFYNLLSEELTDRLRTLREARHLLWFKLLSLWMRS